MVEIKKILNDNGENIVVEVHSPENAKAMVVFCHGITGCRKGRTMEDDYFQVLASRLEGIGYKVVLFDFSGHGESEGFDYDVCLSKSVAEFKKIVETENSANLPINYLAFSYGAAVVCSYLQNGFTKPQSLVFYSPCLFPLKSCFLNENSVFGKDVSREYFDGTMEKNGYAVVGIKGFRLGMKMIDECKSFSPNYISNLSNITFVMSGTEDVILDTQYNIDFCTKYKINNFWFNASHSLFEDIDKVFEKTINCFELFN